MPYRAHGRPAYRRHRQSAQAFVEIGGKRHYYGPYGSSESQIRRSKLVDTWIELGRPRQSLSRSIHLRASSTRRSSCWIEHDVTREAAVLNGLGDIILAAAAPEGARLIQAPKGRDSQNLTL